MRTTVGFKNFGYGLITALAVGSVTAADAAVKPGEVVPSFRFVDVNGTQFTDRDLKRVDLAVLYFFSTQCGPCQAGLHDLQALNHKLQDPGLVAVGVGKQGIADIQRYAASSGLTLRLASGDAETLRAFGALSVFPVVVVAGPEGRVLQVFQGSDASSPVLLAALAEKELQRGHASAARATYADMRRVGGNPTFAKTGEAYSLLMEGKLAEAETTFRDLAEQRDPEVAVKGHEGLAETLLVQGKLEPAQREADIVLKTASDRVVPHLIKGQILYQQGDKQAAESEIVLASAPAAKADFAWQKARAHYARGNTQRQRKNHKEAIAAYRQAVDLDPYFADALSNQGVALQEVGEPEAALKTFRKLQRSSPNDRLVASLLRQAQAAVEQKQDLARQRYIDESVRELAERYRAGQKQAAGSRDDWTSPALALAILGFTNRLGDDLMTRAGLESVLQEELTQQLQKANIKVVDRAILDKLLAELKLGSSALSDQDTTLKLGRVMAARLITTGSLLSLGPGSNTVSLRVIDSETTDIVLPLSERQGARLDPVLAAERFAKSIATTVREKYPLRGRIALVDGNTVIINLGKKHSVVPGMIFNVLGAGQTVELNGRVLGQREAKLGELQVTTVEDLMSYAKVVTGGRWEKNQRIVLK